MKDAVMGARNYSFLINTLDNTTGHFFVQQILMNPDGHRFLLVVRETVIARLRTIALHDKEKGGSFAVLLEVRTVDEVIHAF